MNKIEVCYSIYIDFITMTTLRRSARIAALISNTSVPNWYNELHNTPPAGDYYTLTLDVKNYVHRAAGGKHWFFTESAQFLPYPVNAVGQPWDFSSRTFNPQPCDGDMDPPHITLLDIVANVRK